MELLSLFSSNTWNVTENNSNDIIRYLPHKEQNLPDLSPVYEVNSWSACMNLRDILVWYKNIQSLRKIKIHSTSNDTIFTLWIFKFLSSGRRSAFRGVIIRDVCEWGVWHPLKFKNSIFAGQFFSLQSNVLDEHCFANICYRSEKYIHRHKLKGNLSSFWHFIL